MLTSICAPPFTTLPSSPSKCQRVVVIFYFCLAAVLIVSFTALLLNQNNKKHNLPLENFASNRLRVGGTFLSFLQRCGCHSPLANSCIFLTILCFSSGITCLSLSVFQTSAVHSTSHSRLSNT